MKIERHKCDIPDWYVASGKVKGRLVFGAGRTFYEALINALKA